MKKQMVTLRELDDLGEGIVRDYLKKTGRRGSLSLDIEGFITEYMGAEVLYESFAEDDPGRIGFLSDGESPLLVYRGGKAVPVIFPKDTVVIDRYLLRSDESGRRRFTLAHEVAHMILDRHAPMGSASRFHNEFDPEQVYSLEGFREMFSMGERWADRLAAALLMPRFMVEKAQRKYRGGEPVICYGDGIYSQADKISIQKMADAMGVSWTAMRRQLMDLGIMERRPLEEYITEGLGIGWAEDEIFL